MKKVFLTAALFLVWTSALHAQASRTWVSGVGDDANPCSRTAPCKTFAGAISKTAAGGEISVLDPGGFGAVTITKSITINGSGQLAGILAAGVTGITINAASTDTVILRNISLVGFGTGLTGIRVLNAAAVHVEGVDISGFTTKGISVESVVGANVALIVKDSVIRNNRGANSGGILIKPTGTATAVITNTQVQQNTFGLRVEDRGNTTAANSDFSNNENNGVAAFAAAQAAAINLESCTVTNNKTSSGVLTSGANSPVVRLSNVDIFNNLTGINITSGSVVSFGNNRVFQNTNNVSGVVTNTPQI